MIKASIAFRRSEKRLEENEIFWKESELKTIKREINIAINSGYFYIELKVDKLYLENKKILLELGYIIDESVKIAGLTPLTKIFWDRKDLK